MPTATESDHNESLEHLFSGKREPLEIKNPRIPRVLLCTECQNSVKMEVFAAQVVSDWALFKQGKLNRVFLDKSIFRMQQLLEKIDTERG